LGFCFGLCFLTGDLFLRVLLGAEALSETIPLRRRVRLPVTMNDASSSPHAGASDALGRLSLSFQLAGGSLASSSSLLEAEASLEEDE
jgi:hypothetical protein